MPITLTVTEGVLVNGSEREAIKGITNAFLKWHQLTGNTVMTPNITSHINILPKGHTLSGGVPFSGAWIETRTPSFALSDREIQEGFFKEATDIVEKLSEGRIPRKDIYASAVHTVDGTWNMDGKAMTNEQLGEAISHG